MNAKNPPYTAQSCREEAAINDKFGDPIMNDPDLLRAHADALEENARLTRECEFHAKQCARVDELRHRAEAELAVARDELEVVRHGHRKVCDRMNNAEAELAKLRQAIELAARAMGGEGVNDQGEAWDKCLRILDAARADFPEGKK